MNLSQPWVNPVECPDCLERTTCGQAVLLARVSCCHRCGTEWPIVPPTALDRAIDALAAWLNGSPHEVAAHYFIAARLILERLDRDALLADAIELEE